MEEDIYDFLITILIFTCERKLHTKCADAWPWVSKLRLSQSGTIMVHVGLFRIYSRVLYYHPLAFIILSVILTGLIPLGVLYFFPVKLSSNAEIGFDTKDTEFSGPRIAWQKLQFVLQTSNRIPFSNTHTLNSTKRIKKANNRLRRSWGDSLLSVFQNVPCYDAPIPLMDHLSQVVLEIPSYESMFELPLLRQLCQMHQNISVELSAFDSFTPYRSIWNVANFFACMSPNFLVNCTELTVDDVHSVHQLLNYCSSFRNQLVNCRIACEETCSKCEGVPLNCSSTMMFDLFYRLLPQDLNSKPFYLNTFLPVFTLTGYATQNLFIPLDLYNNLEEAIVNYTTHEGLTMKGLSMDVKRDRLLPAAIADSFLALLAAGLVIAVVAFHSRSILYAVAVCIILSFSVLGSLSFYSLWTSDFPLLNLVIFVLLIAIGTDDAFLLFSHFPEDLNELSFNRCLAHTSATMFLTSFSTAVPFFVNVLSNVIVFRCFGLFAGVTILVNYFLVVSFLPAFLILQRRWCSCLPSLPDLGSWMSYSFRSVLPSVLLQGRFIWLASLSIVVVSAFVISFSDLRLPEYNPLQLFIASNPHEWYDNNAERMFSFVSSKIAIPLFARLVWGVQPVQSTAMFKADALTPLMSDPSFSLSTVPEIKKLANTLSHYRSLPFINHSEPFWPEKFLRWSHEYSCSIGFLCCNMSHVLFSNTYLDYCLRNSTSFLFTSYNDTPIFDNSSFALTGYTALLPTKLKYSHRFSRLSHSFSLLSTLVPDGGWWTPEWPLMSTWFDLQRSIVSDVRSSVFVSIAVVALFAIVQLKVQAIPAVITCVCIIASSVGLVVLLGWVIGVLEAVILVLVVGLSFDYTLHYGAALPDDGCPSHRIRRAASVASIPVSLSAFTSFLAGASMLFSRTHAFFQVGVFLVVLTITSWLFATFFFLPLLSLTLPRRKDCVQCNRIHNIPMSNKF